MLPSLHNLAIAERQVDRPNTDAGIVFGDSDAKKKQAVEPREPRRNPQAPDALFRDSLPEEQKFGAENLRSVRETLEEDQDFAKLWRRRMMKFMIKKQNVYNKELEKLVTQEQAEIKRLDGLAKPFTVDQQIGPEGNRQDIKKFTDNRWDTVEDFASDLFRITQSKVQFKAIVDRAKEREDAITSRDWVKKELKPFQEALDELLKNFGSNGSLLQQLGDLVRGFVRDEDMTFTEDSFLNMSVTGRAGVGKTFFAEHLARFMGASGVLVFDEYIVVSRADLIGQYIGQTAPLVRSVFTKNLENVVFLDEAYALTTYTQDPVKRDKASRVLDQFSGEAVTELLTILNDLRGRMSLVVAGYADKINNDFFAANEGLRRRFTYFFNLPDYTPAELLGIYERSLSKLLKVKDSELERIKDSGKEYFKKLVKAVKDAYKEDEELITAELATDDDDAKSVRSMSSSASTVSVPKKSNSEERHRENEYSLIYDFFNQQGGAAVQLAQATNLMLKAYATKDNVITDQTMFGIVATRLAERQGAEEAKEQILQQLAKLTANIVDKSAGPLEGKAWEVWQDGVKWDETPKQKAATPAGAKRKK
jgi:hypothetical protein